MEGDIEGDIEGDVEGDIEGDVEGEVEGVADGEAKTVANGDGVGEAKNVANGDGVGVATKNVGKGEGDEFGAIVTWHSWQTFWKLSELVRRRPPSPTLHHPVSLDPPHT